MKLSSITEAMADYTRITGEEVECDARSEVKILPTNEWMIWRLGVLEGIPYFYIDQTYAKSFSVFCPFIREVCAAAEITTIATATQRPKAFLRKWKMEIVSEYTHEGRNYTLLQTHISNMK
jgi:hypothetical protein